MCSADLALEPHEPNDLDEGVLDAAWNGRHGELHALMDIDASLGMLTCWV